jgi:hypothetical protein
MSGNYKFRNRLLILFSLILIPILFVAFYGMPGFIKGCKHCQTTTELDSLIVAYDMGDLNALKPVAAKLNEKGHRIALLGLGQAHKALQTPDKPAYVMTLSPAETFPREQLLTETEMKTLMDTCQPKIVLVGMASAAQAQILNAYQNKAITIAYYDNFENPRKKEYIKPFIQQIQLKKLFAFYLPSEVTKGFFKTFLKDLNTCNSTAQVVVGNPSLEEWDRIFAETNPTLLRTKLGIPTDKKVIIFAGGYGGSYEIHFKIFVEGVKDQSDIQVLVTHHPKTDGHVEEDIIKEVGAPNVRLLKASSLLAEDAKLFTTPALSTIANLVACNESSVGLQAFYKGKPVLFVADPKSYRNFLIEQGLSSIVWTPTGVKEAINKISADTTQNRLSLAKIGIPTGATDRIVEALEAILKEPTQLKQFLKKCA